jgi:hypothetical protein
MKESQKEKYSEKLYNNILNNIIKPITGSNTTYENDLYDICNKLFGDKFMGVFPSDKIPLLTLASPYAILNLDKSTEQGSHWVAISKVGKNTYIYDSFGRHNVRIIPSLSVSGNGKIVDTDRDAEQKMIQLDCGARVIGWLLFLDEWGIEYAKYI